MEQLAHSTLFTDGSSLGNPGPGGWGAILVLARPSGGQVIELGGRAEHTTNNRMELVALIEGLERIKDEPGDTIVYLDSSYVHKGATEWSRGWIKNGWQTKAKKDVENRDLWEALLPLLEERNKFGTILWKHIPGHSGIAGNERADAIATGFAEKKAVQLFEGDIETYTVDILNTAVDKRVAEKRSVSRAHSRAKAYSYLSLVKGVAKRHMNWPDCEKRVKGVAGAKYKKALSHDDEEQILKDWGVRSE